QFVFPRFSTPDGNISARLLLSRRFKRDIPLENKRMHHPLPSSTQTDAIWLARVHLAAANRLAVYDQLEEGIDNHFTMMVPGYDDRYLVLPFGRHWSEARASDLIVFDETGNV